MKHILMAVFTMFIVTACQQKDTNSEAYATEDKPSNNKTPPKEVVLKACSKDAKVCPDGNSVSRDPANNCEFHACNEIVKGKKSITCTADVKECPDGTFVSRNHKNNCKFKDCPGSEQ
jgi:hypothetical protein